LSFFSDIRASVIDFFAIKKLGEGVFL